MSQNRSSSRRNLALAAAWFLLTFLALMAFWAACVRPFYVEPAYAELVNTTRMYHPHLANFFLGPVNRYATTYTEWTRLSRDFIRPVVALDYYFWSCIFGSNFAAYLIGTYLSMAALCGMAFYIASELLELPLALSHLVAALVFLSPANSEQEHFQATFAPDPLAAFWILAASLFFFRRSYLPAWLCITLAVATKETTWPLAIGMGLLYLVLAGHSRSRRILGLLAFILPLGLLLTLRVRAFGLRGLLTGDRADPSIHGAAAAVQAQHASRLWITLTSGPIAGIAQRIVSWPLGVTLDSFQYDSRITHPIAAIGIAFNIGFWIIATTATLAFLSRSWRSDPSRLRPTAIRAALHRLRSSADPFPARRLALVVLTLFSLVFLMRFGSPPRYGSAAFPLLFLCAAAVLASVSAWLPRLLAVLFLVLVGLNGLALDLSDLHHGVNVYRRLGQLELGFLHAIQSSPGNPVFVINDVAGGENNSEAFRRAFGPQVHLVRINDLATSCFSMPEDTPPPVSFTIDAQRTQAHTLLIHSTIEGCGGHEFFEVPGLPDGPIQRHSEGFTLTYQLLPRANPQPTVGPPRQMIVRIDNVPPGALLIAPDFAHHTYISIPIH